MVVEMVRFSFLFFFLSLELYMVFFGLLYIWRGNGFGLNLLNHNIK